ncbi:hypothetical protein [Sphingobium sp. AS12]|nr:hypothetical protein [Sphingobium sp. AS12]
MAPASKKVFMRIIVSVPDVAVNNGFVGLASRSFLDAAQSEI